MGNPHYSDDGFQCFNPAKNFQLNWYNDAKITEDVTIEGYSNTLTLVGIGEYGNRGGNPVTVRLETGTSADYFVGFNRATGPNRFNDQGDNKVSIIQVTQNNGQSYAQSYLKALLSQGQSHTIPNFGGTGKTVTVTVDSIDISNSPGTAIISINDGLGPSGPQTATFDESLEAPKCSYGSRCDSGDLLNGRALMINGNEPNTPNTLNECSDGSVGTYHSDESVDKIVVSRADGGSGDFTEGDEVTITATVFCYSSGSSNYIDFYYAQNANSPAWMTIAIRENCPGGQVQTVSRNLVLQSAGLQAVRVNLMYGTGSAGTNKCTSGYYDDTDDLVISVRPNAIASINESGKDKAKTDVEKQGAIVEVQHDKRADDAVAALVQLNGSIRAANAEDESSKKSKKSKSDKEAVVSANAISATSKYVCQTHKPFDASICANGVAEDNKCSYTGQSCGRKGKLCYFAECADSEGAD